MFGRASGSGTGLAATVWAVADCATAAGGCAAVGVAFFAGTGELAAAFGLAAAEASGGFAPFFWSFG
jgi:hypothetical protein